MADALDLAKCAIQVMKKNNQRSIGAAVLSRSQKSLELIWRLDLFEFLDNEQFSNFDSLLLSIGDCEICLPEEISDQSKLDNRKILGLIKGKNLVQHNVNKSLFKSANIDEALRKLVGDSSHVVNVADTECPQAYGCIQCLIKQYDLLKDQDSLGKYYLHLSSLNSFMKLDSAAAEAVNLLPHISHPSKYGSIFGVLNRCKTKMGQRLLERWLRQPLLDDVEINKRLDVVQIFTSSAVARNRLLEGPLHNLPDLELIISKMEKKNAGLSEIFRIYLFTKCIPRIVSILEEFIELSSSSQINGEDYTAMSEVVRDRYLSPLSRVCNKFELYQQLVEHVLDMSQLPDLYVSAQHDEVLQELKEELEGLAPEAEKVLMEAQGHFISTKLDIDPIHGYSLRLSKPTEERELKSANKKYQIITIQKNGVHFTTPTLRTLGERLRAVESSYKTLQQEVVRKAVETAATYLPVVESACYLISELDVLLSFATVAALSPDPYVRPRILPRGEGIIRFKEARHPCVELMDDMRFIANDYELQRDISGFQIITGPNMGGKSTYLRGVGSIVVMAQIGSFVPCSEAEFSVVDCVLARVGAGDAVQRGVSTFMAEMLEAAVILRTATPDSLIIIDELGRGTSTFDGFGLAWAISEYIASKLRCLCLFATHFHELTALDKDHTGIANKHVTAEIDDNKVKMLYRVQSGPCTQSFGVHVARTAGFPASVLQEAKRKADQLEQVGQDEEDPKITNAKRACMEDTMNAFCEVEVNKLSATEVKNKLKDMFPSYNLMV